MFTRVTVLTCWSLKQLSEQLEAGKITFLVFKCNQWSLSQPLISDLVLSSGWHWEDAVSLFSASDQSSLGLLWGYCCGAVIVMLFIPLTDLLLQWEHCCLCQSGITQLPRERKLTTLAHKLLCSGFIKHETWHQNNLITCIQQYRFQGIRQNIKNNNIYIESLLIFYYLYIRLWRHEIDLWFSGSYMTAASRTTAKTFI